jgi:hypothetical protein
MTDEVKTTPEEAVIPTEETVTPESEVQSEPTLAEAMPENKAEPKTVGLDKFLEQKRTNKELKQRLEELETRIEQGTTRREVSKDIRSLAEQHNVDPEFLEGFADAIRERAESAVEEKLRPLTEREALSHREKLFNTHLTNALEEMPEYKDVVNADILKQLAFNPANQNKTFRQLLEDVYGNVQKNRKTIETTTARPTVQTFDYDRAQSDPAYFKEVMADPQMKAMYNESMLKRLS